MSELQTTPRLSLSAVEELLDALMETEGAVPEEQRASFERDLVAAQLAAVDKRDAVGYVLARWERKLFIKAKHPDTGKTITLHGEIDMEIDRLKELKASIQRSYDRLNTYVLDVIFSLPKDAKGALRKLEGSTSVLSAQANPESLDEAIDMDLLPTEFKRVTVQMGMQLWKDLQGNLAVLMTLKEVEPLRQAIKDALQAGVKVPGAKLAPRKYRVVRK